MRNVTEIQQRLIALGYPVGPAGADGKFGHDTLGAYNRWRAQQGKPPVGSASMATLNRDLFPEEQPAPKPPKPNFFTGLALKAILNHLKGLPAMNFLTGQKTIVTGILMVIAGAVSLLAPLVGLGDVPGFNALSPGEAWTSLTTGFGLIFLRNGLTNEVSKAGK